MTVCFQCYHLQYRSAYILCRWCLSNTCPIYVCASGSGSPGSRGTDDTGAAKPFAPLHSNALVAVAAVAVDDVAPPPVVIVPFRFQYGGLCLGIDALLPVILADPRRHMEGKLNPTRQQPGQEMTSSCSVAGGNSEW